MLGRRVLGSNLSEPMFETNFSVKDSSWDEYGGNFTYGNNGLVLPENLIGNSYWNNRVYGHYYLNEPNSMFMHVNFTPHIDFRNVKFELTNIVFDTSILMKDKIDGDLILMFMLIDDSVNLIKKVYVIHSHKIILKNKTIFLFGIDILYPNSITTLMPYNENWYYRVYTYEKTDIIGKYASGYAIPEIGFYFLHGLLKNISLNNELIADTVGDIHDDDPLAEFTVTRIRILMQKKQCLGLMSLGGMKIIPITGIN